MFSGKRYNVPENLFKHRISSDGLSHRLAISKINVHTKYSIHFYILYTQFQSFEANNLINNKKTETYSFQEFKNLQFCLHICNGHHKNKNTVSLNLMHAIKKQDKFIFFFLLNCHCVSLLFHPFNQDHPFYFVIYFYLFFVCF